MSQSIEQKQLIEVLLIAVLQIIDVQWFCNRAETKLRSLVVYL